MNSTLAVHFLPMLTTAEELAAGMVVMIDVLRAGTTLTAALAAGAREVLPFAEVDAARSMGAKLAQQHKEAISAGDGRTIDTALVSPPVLGGERGGLPIEGFDMGNSPSEYTPQAVWRRTIVFTTTNGTPALEKCVAAQRVLLGAFVNYSAVLRQLTGELPIHLLCAGTRGRISRDDILFAGAIVSHLAGPVVEEDDLNDQARIARDVWLHAMGRVRPTDSGASRRIAEALRNTQGGRNLIGVGLQRDIDDAAVVDCYDIVPVFDAANGRIVKV